MDWRLGQLRERPNVSLYPGSELGADDILGLEHDHVVVATGARWTKMLFSTLEFPVGELDLPGVYTPDDLAAGGVPPGPVVVFDFDNYYLGGAIAEQLAKQTPDVHYVTTAGNASAWTFMTNELPLVHRALVAAGVRIHTLHRVVALRRRRGDPGGCVQRLRDPAPLPVRSSSSACASRGASSIESLEARSGELKDAGILSITRIGDALAPGAIVHAVHSGHRLCTGIRAGRTGRGRHRRGPRQGADRPALCERFPGVSAGGLAFPVRACAEVGYAAPRLRTTGSG